MNELRIDTILTEKTQEAIKKLYEQVISSNQITLQKTRPEFDGDITLLVFPLTKASKKSPEETANAIGNYLKENVAEVTAFNVVKGFLNLVIADSYWANYLLTLQPPTSDLRPPTSETVMVEFSSPNTNKPLHLGHVRNNLLGISVSEILKAAGKKVIRVNLVNDRGIHICKSMLAWKGRANGETPETTTDPALKKGDHFVGHYYVEFDKAYKKEISDFINKSEEFVELISKWKKTGNFSSKEFEVRTSVGIGSFFVYCYLVSWKYDKKIEFEIPKIDIFLDNPEKYLKQLNLDLQDHIKYYIEELSSKIKLLKLSDVESPEFKEQLRNLFKDFTPIVYSAHLLLRLWEAGDPETIALWKKMNGWVYDGFAKTYKELGVEFEKTYYESETYLLGKKIVEEGLSKGVFTKRDDGSVWVDLTKDGLDEKLLLRSDGTSVYITQDLGTIVQRANEFHFDKHIYVVGNEQDYHFKVLFLILKKLGYDWADKLFHLSYGMVDLPSGKMKSREGTVVDADELMEDMVSSARETTKALGKTEGMTEAEAEKLYHTIGLGALKYFILKVDAKKRMLFDPKESIDFNGNTGPFIQYTYARIKSVLRKVGEIKSEVGSQKSEVKIQKQEKGVIKLLHDFLKVVSESADSYNPGHIANYVYELAKEYNQFYHEVPILKSENEQEKNFRLLLSAKTAEVIKTSLKLLGINVSERM